MVQRSELWVINSGHPGSSLPEVSVQVSLKFFRKIMCECQINSKLTAFEVMQLGELLVSSSGLELSPHISMSCDSSLKPKRTWTLKKGFTVI